MSCEHCGNEFGFVFGTCIDCGHNKFSNSFETIRVDVNVLRSLLPEQIVEKLIDNHADVTMRDSNEEKEQEKTEAR